MTSPGGPGGGPGGTSEMAGPLRGGRFDDPPDPTVNVRIWTFDAKRPSWRSRRGDACRGRLPMEGGQDMDVRATDRVRNRRALMIVSVCAVIALAIPAVSLAIGSSSPRGITVYVGLSNGTSYGYRSAGVGNGWTRTSSIDAPD